MYNSIFQRNLDKSTFWKVQAELWTDSKTPFLQQMQGEKL